MLEAWSLRCASLLALAGLPACGAGALDEPKQQPPAPLAVPHTPEFSARWPVLEGYAVDTVVDRAAKLPPLVRVPAVMARCARPTPAFAFDADAVETDDAADLARLAACLTKGPFRDRHVEVVGRADARGDALYNVGLGLRRAARVKDLLVDHGVAPARIAVRTRGARDAVGGMSGYTDQDDRRVDVRLTD